MYTARPAAFAYERPSSLEEALGLLAEPGARPLAGGHSLLPAMKLRLDEPSALVDLRGLPALDEISPDGATLVVGALTTHATVAASEVVRRSCPVLAEAAALIGDRQVRNRGTIGGSVAHADPSADYPTVLTALGATIVTVGRQGERGIAAGDFFEGVFTTALEPGELVVRVEVPATPRAVYLKHRHPASSYAVVGVAAVADGDGGRIAVGGLAGAPQVFEGSTAEAADAVATSVKAEIGDTYASAEYRQHLAGVLARRAVEQARA